MGYDLGKRLTELRRQTDDNFAARFRSKRIVILFFIALVVARYSILPLHRLPSDNLSEELAENTSSNNIWIADTQDVIKDRTRWLRESPLVIMPGSSSIYQNFARSLDETFTLVSPEPDSPDDFEAFFSYQGISLSTSRMLVGSLLRLSFIIIAFLPLWVIGLFAGYLITRWHIRKRESFTILGVCDRDNGPFYSGIYGAYRPNNSMSATEMSCPSLACPAIVEREKVLNHRLYSQLKASNAVSETGISLLQVILAHSDFPHFVEEENPIQGDEVKTPVSERVSNTGFYSNEDGTLLQGVGQGLPATLAAHATIRKYILSLQSRKITLENIENNFPSHVKALEKASKGMPELCSFLVNSLTAERMWALAQLSPSIIASAYLAIEAGKALVYKKIAGGYSRISVFPHLQARAVIQSVRGFHDDLTGDERLIIRQAIISSRRHGDFGRVFLPMRMPSESRALRDWLEILYATPLKRESVADLVEVDAHLEEVHVNLRNSLKNRITNYQESHPLTEKSHPLWKGLVYKSVVLLPLSELITMTLGKIHPERQKKILSLLDSTRQSQADLSKAARLPGFKRQAMEGNRETEILDPIVKRLISSTDGEIIYDQWRIIRRMLTRYNWLSTRVGDDSVPLVGLLHGLLRQETDERKTKYLSLDALVPLRTRRYDDLLGKSWEHSYYRFSPRQDDVHVYTETAEYENQLNRHDAKPASGLIVNEEKVTATG